MTKLEKLRSEIERITKEIERLSEFRETAFLKKFRRQLEGEKSVLNAKIAKMTKTTEDVIQRLIKANENRSAKMKTSWRYFKAIKENYPIDMSLKEIRSAFKKHKQGLETDIPDVAWRNPSP